MYSECPAAMAFPGDWVEINIDSYNDKRTAFSFNLSASGVKGDEYISNNGDNWDTNWDPIWYAKTNIDELGWTAEMRIPLSQLSFADKPQHVWGIQFTRRYFRNEERSIWQFIPQDAPGWVHLFGELHGLEGIRPQKQVEIQPYVVGKVENFDEEKGNPFTAENKEDVSVGLDGKIGITSDITLDFTVNPDFGQVEADPSQVNLSAFEIFFEEQRPFFIEGNNILDFGLTESGAGGSFNSDNLFYSRRIGRNPHHEPDTDDDEYLDQPDNTSILGAIKLTGKNKKGFSWGLLESVTAKEEAEIDRNGERRQEVVEPLTNFLVGRVQQDINKGNTIIGGMFTSTNRNIKDPALDFLHTDAYSGGLDFVHNMNDRAYFVSAKSFWSHVQGSEEAILETQTSSERYFQRPNADHVEVDSSRTSLTGTGGTLKFGKNSGKVIFESGVSYRSPELELNDVGFLRSTDQINQWTWGQYRILKPFGIFRWFRLNGNQYLHWDFSGVNTYRAVNMNARMQFKNFWNFNTGVTLEDDWISNADLRGGPSIKYPGGFNHWYWFGTNERKKLRWEFNQWNYWGFDGYQRDGGYWMRFTYRPIDALTVSLSPSFRFNENEMQYVETIEDFGTQNRYITGTIDQTTYVMQFRFTYNINPNLSIQYWGQPFISSGEYSEFKRITNSLASDYNDRFELISANEISYDPGNEEFLIDETLDGTTDYTFEDPDFNFVQFRSNMVARWEYIPGSTVFLVWTQERTDGLPINVENGLNDLTRGLFDKEANNIFLVKFTYRFTM